MPCIARSEDGTVDQALCESISLHPIKNHQICNQKGFNCDSPYRICRVCAGQRFRVFGCYRKEWKTVQPVDLENVRAISSISGLCYDHHMQAQEKEPFTDRFPPKVASKPPSASATTSTATTQKRRGRKPHLREIPEDELIRDICGEMGELLAADFDPDEDLGAEPCCEIPEPPPAKKDLPIHPPVYQRAQRAAERPVIPVQPKREFRAVEIKPVPARVPFHPPSPTPKPAPIVVPPLVPTAKPSLQRNPKLEELDKLRAFLAQPSSGGGVIVEGDED